MRKGYLSEYFEGVAVKRLHAVEADLVRSHQHEFNGVNDLKTILGQPVGKERLQAKFIYLNDWDDEPVVADAFMTWYDARENHPTRSECRLYFPTTPVSQCASEGDLLVIGKRPDNTLLVIIAEGGSTIANQLLWLFGFSGQSHPGFSVKSEVETNQDRLTFASRLILENIGVELEDQDENLLDLMLDRFRGTFPTTREFSQFARSTVADVSSQDDPDTAIVVWMDREEILFRTLERHLIADRLQKGFGMDVDGFLSFSISIQQRRRSRAGDALENHLEQLFLENGVAYSREKITENRSKPDFIFPGIEHYHNPSFSADLLTMLGVKTTSKDRWRQVLAEADRISRKHLLTLEPGISTNQTNEMQAKELQLVLPKALHSTYTENQQSWLMDVEEFIELVRDRQKGVNIARLFP